MPAQPACSGAPEVVGQLQGPFQKVLAHDTPCKAQSTGQPGGLQGCREQLEQHLVGLPLRSLLPCLALCLTSLQAPCLVLTQQPQCCMQEVIPALRAKAPAGSSAAQLQLLMTGPSSGAPPKRPPPSPQPHADSCLYDAH